MGHLATGLLLALPIVFGFTASPPPEDSVYIVDFEFIEKTVSRQGAAVPYRKIDWKAVSKEFRPRFEACTSDRDHVENVMRYLAVLGDAHTGVTRHSIDHALLPSKFDGLYGAGMDFAYDDGRFWLRGLMDGHSLQGSVAPGDTLVAVDGLPAWLAMEREKRRQEALERAKANVRGKKDW